MSAAPIKNRVTEITGTDYPIIQAPMSWIARAQLASAVCNAGGLGIIETGSGELDAIRGEVQKMRELTDKPFGMNVALAFVKGTNFIDFVIEQGLPFVTTSSGSPAVCTEIFQQAGIKVFHVVPTLDMALKAIDCGVDGLIVEGGRHADGVKPPHGPREKEIDAINNADGSRCDEIAAYHSQTGTVHGGIGKPLGQLAF